MLSRLSLLCVAAVLTGCSFAPVKLTDEAPPSPVPFASVVIEDLSTYVKPNTSEFVWVNGWARADDGFEPTINRAFVAKAKRGIVPGTGSGELHVSVIRAGLWAEKSYADDMFVVGLFRIASERGFKCDAEVSLRSSGSAERVTLEHSIRRPYFDNQEQIRQFAEDCQVELVRKLADAARRKH